MISELKDMIFISYIMKTPTIQWSQNDNYIFLDIHLEPKEYDIKIEEKSLVFKQGEYEVNMTLYSNIKSEESKYNKNRIFEFYLKKNDEEIEWKQLLENRNQYNVSINWDKYDVEDDELPDMSSMMCGGGMPDMSSMMGGMPGDFASMGGCCEDEDCQGCDEEILGDEEDLEEINEEDLEEINEEDLDEELEK